MHVVLLALCLFASTAIATHPDSSLSPPSAVARPKSGGIRLTYGLGGGSFGLAGAGRLLVVPPGTPWRVGVQGTAMSELALFISPNENMGALHVVAARELVSTGPASVLLFGGLGGASWERRGQRLGPDPDDPDSDSFGFTDEYESIKGRGPSVLAGIDLGLSFRRIVGASLQLGAEAGGANSVYLLLQADVGSW
jgi:hypothetical protein